MIPGKRRRITAGILTAIYLICGFAATALLGSWIARLPFPGAGWLGFFTFLVLFWIVDGPLGESVHDWFSGYR